jgi:hypothetical protein
MDIAKPDPNPNLSASPRPAMKVFIGMYVAPNPNPPDIRISMDIHGFTQYVHYHNNIRKFCPFSNNYMNNGEEGE